MLYRSIYIGNPAYLKLKDKQLKVTDPETKEEKGSVPIEDIGLLMLDHYQITLSHQLIQELMKNNVILISCDERHLPLAGMLPFSGNFSTLGMGYSLVSWLVPWWIQACYWSWVSSIAVSITLIAWPVILWSLIAPW